MYLETTETWALYPKLVALRGHLGIPQSNALEGLSRAGRSAPRGRSARSRVCKARGGGEARAAPGRAEWDLRAATLWPALARWFPRGPARSSHQGARWPAPRISELRGPTSVRHIGCRSRCCQRFLLRLRCALLVPAARAAGR